MTDKTTISSSSEPHGGRRALLRSLFLLLAMIPGSLAAAQETRHVTVVAARAGEVVGTATATGMVVARDEVPVHAEVEGEIIRVVLAETGDFVAADAALAVIDTADAELALAKNAVELRRARMLIEQERARLEKARVSEAEAATELTRNRSLVANGAVSERALSERENEQARAAADLALARHALEVAEAELELVERSRAEIERTVEKSTVRAPTAGLVLARNARTGHTASLSGEPLFVLAEDGVLELEAEVAEADFVRVRTGQTARFRIEGNDMPLVGRVRHRAAQIDAASRLGRVRIALDDPEGLVAGAFVSGRIDVVSRRAILLPASAIRFAGNGAAIVTVVEDGIVSKREVTTDLTQGDLIEVIDGIAPGERVVLKAGSFLKDGERVTPALFEYRLPNERSGNIAPDEASRLSRAG
ncbi:efflux RND transporter periplasmic adaptor subunit [Martelella mediterranea]|uniref:Macrolide-specific efflux protein MacA n=1 Tax=Martelella mediterranea DSM 17316 TaxID=1122214 RepID=A0A1U9Z4G6_9HYPH|nr:efflux RND transporter periplasmic adaptor subunit [Martelella mediterranea]AQZ52554.1 Macrolide-specific efflux protein MacA precursor [Martelella mediterranea DSM 17316]